MNFRWIEFCSFPFRMSWLISLKLWFKYSLIVLDIVITYIFNHCTCFYYANIPQFIYFISDWHLGCFRITQRILLWSIYLCFWWSHCTLYLVIYKGMELLSHRLYIYLISTSRQFPYTSANSAWGFWLCWQQCLWRVSSIFTVC